MRMRLSVVFELLLVFLFLAFAAARVIDPANGNKNVAKGNKKTTVLRQGPPNRYCACTSRMCNCCRDFSLPVVPLKGPGCASIMYVQRDTMMVTMSFGDRVLSNTTISGKSPKPICMALPGGISQFCGRIYGISRKGDQFRACLGLELRALDDIEAALRVSCFKFGPKGVKLESAPPVPVETGGKDPEEDDEEDYDLDDDEDDDLIGFGVDDEDDGSSNEDNEVDSDSVDYAGFSVLGEDLLGTFFSDDSGSSTKKKKPSKKTAKPQVVVPKVSSTTTKRPFLPNRRRPTIKPLSLVTKRPLLNRITKNPAPATSRPLLVQKPFVPVVSSQTTEFIPTVSVSSTIVTKNDLDKNVETKIPEVTTEVPPIITRVTIGTPTKESDRVEVTGEEEVHATTLVQTEEPITFTVPTQKVEAVKNDIRLPQTDLDKVEAVAAIAQQLVPSGVISPGSVSSEETKKPLNVMTVSYEKTTPTIMEETASSQAPAYIQKISSVKFSPTTVVTSRPIEDEIVDTNTNLSTEVAGTKHKVTILQQSMDSETSNEDKKDNQKLGEGGNDKEYVNNISIKKNPLTKKGNFTVNVKKQQVKKPVKEEQQDEEEEEEEEEEEDLLEGVLSDDDDNTPEQTSADENTDDEAEDDDDENETSGEAEETSQKIKPTKVSIKRPPASDEKEDDEEEEEEDEEDILDVLGDDEEEEDSEDDEDDEDNEPEKKPIKLPVSSTTKATTIRIKRPTTQQTIQTRKPITNTESTPAVTTPEENVTSDKVPEKIFVYREPIEGVTQKVIIYQEPQNNFPNKIFIYKEPENKITEKTTQKVIFYEGPGQQNVPEKFIIYKEPEEKQTEGPLTDSKDSTKYIEEIKEDDSDEEEKAENDEESSSEEELEDDTDSEKHTLMASIAKPEFSNKYAEEHDLTEADDLDIEDSENDDHDFDEDRKMKYNHKKPTVKPPSTKKSPPADTKPKILTLSSLITQHKKYHAQPKNERIISTSRTHRRMNLDRLLQV